MALTPEEIQEIMNFVNSKAKELYGFAGGVREATNWGYGKSTSIPKDFLSNAPAALPLLKQAATKGAAGVAA